MEGVRTEQKGVRARGRIGCRHWHRGGCQARRCDPQAALSRGCSRDRFTEHAFPELGRAGNVKVEKCKARVYPWGPGETGVHAGGVIQDEVGTGPFMKV